jgi:CelD/BcsL family acetyltransferase involved in cellulose biosynthesis
MGVAAEAVDRMEGRGITTDVVTDAASFARLEPEWNDALRRAHVTYPFLLHEWLRTWWDCFGAGSQLHVVVARDSQGIAGIAPMMVEQAHMYGLPLCTLDLIHNDHTPRADWIIVRSPEDTCAALWNALRCSPVRWDLLQLSRLPDDSPARVTVSALAEREGCLTGTWRGDVSPYLTLPETWDSYWASRTSKFRSNLRNRLSRLSQFGEARLEVIDDGADVRACEDALRLEASGWKTETQTSIASTPAVRQFYLALAERAAASGWLRLLFLSVNGQRIATSYSARFADTLFLIKTGYDPAFAACAPFKLLTYFAIQHACAEGLRQVDFLGDAEAWKREWTDTSRPHDWLYVFSDTVRGRLLHSLKFQVAPGLKQWRA